MTEVPAIALLVLPLQLPENPFLSTMGISSPVHL